MLLQNISRREGGFIHRKHQQTYWGIDMIFSLFLFFRCGAVVDHSDDDDDDPPTEVMLGAGMKIGFTSRPMNFLLVKSEANQISSILDHHPSVLKTLLVVFALQ